MRQAGATRQYLAAPDELEQRLRRWGLAYGVRPDRDPEDEVEPEGESPIARVVVDRSRERDLREDDGWRPAPRVNLTRKRIRQMLGDTCRVPSWAGGDPIRAPKGGGGGGESMPIAKDAEEVELAVLALMRWDRRAGLALRACYCLLGRRPRQERIDWVAKASGTKVSRTGYAAAIARGRLAVRQALKIAG